MVMPKDENYDEDHSLIEPDFYAILKELGLCTFRYSSGGKYKDCCSQTAWDVYQIMKGIDIPE